MINSMSILDWIVIRTKYGEATIERELIEKIIRDDPEETDKPETSPARKNPISVRISTTMNQYFIFTNFSYLYFTILVLT